MIGEGEASEEFFVRRRVVGNISPASAFLGTSVDEIIVHPLATLIAASDTAGIGGGSWRPLDRLGAPAACLEGKTRIGSHEGADAGRLARHSWEGRSEPSGRAGLLNV
jgi:hypothetical protein